MPDAGASCGPYAPAVAPAIATREVELKTRRPATAAYGTSAGRSHDTISMVAIHADGTMAAGMFTNGASHKVPRRIGNGPITSSGFYINGDIGGYGVIRDGNIIMRFLPYY